MTRYDEPEAADGRGGPHPLAGVPQAALDAATAALAEADRTPGGDLHIDGEDVEAVAHAVLASALDALRDATTPSTRPSPSTG